MTASTRAVLPANLRGMIFMVLATGSFVCNDTFLKLATEGLPPFQTVFLRGVAGALWCFPLVAATGNLRHMAGAIHPWVALRNTFEGISVLCYIVALANLPIANVIALNQTAPLLLLIGVSVLYGDRIGVVRMALIATGFLGALLVAQPSAEGISIYVLLGFGCAVFTAARDITGRRVPAGIPALVVTYSTILIVLVICGLAMVFFEHWQPVDTGHLVLFAGAGLFLVGGHFFVFLAYRTGATGAVAPFYYTLGIWAVISGIAVFQTVPNAMTISGIALILGGGVAVALLDERRRRRVAAALA
jgi:S-adenosylmethionine uptake transporter